MSVARRTGGRIRQGLFAVMLGACVVTYMACSSGGGDGGTAGAPPPGGEQPPPSGGASNDQFAYVINGGESDIQAFRVDGDGNFTPAGGVFTGNLPHHVRVDPQGRFVYVSNHDAPFLSGFRINEDASLAAINPAPFSPVTGPANATDLEPLTSAQPHSSAMDQNGEYLYVVAGHGASTLKAYRIDAGSGALTWIEGQSFPVGTHAHHLAISPNNQFVYVASDGSGEVHAFSRNTANGALTSVGTITGLPGASAVVVDPPSTFLFATYTNAVEVFTIGTNGGLTRITPTSTFPTQSGPHSATMHPNGRFFYAANINPGTISVYSVDTTTGALTDIQSPAPTTGNDPHYLVIQPNQRFLYSADAGSNQLSRFTINEDGTLALDDTIPMGRGPVGIGMTRFE